MCAANEQRKALISAPYLARCASLNDIILVCGHAPDPQSVQVSEFLKVYYTGVIARDHPSARCHSAYACISVEHIYLNFSTTQIFAVFFPWHTFFIYRDEFICFYYLQVLYLYMEKDLFHLHIVWDFS